MCTPLIVHMAGVRDQTPHVLCIYHCLHCCILCSFTSRCISLRAPLMQSSLKCGCYLRLFKSSASARYRTRSEPMSALVTHVQVPSVPLVLSCCCLLHPDHMLVIHCTIDISAHTLLKMWLLVLYCSHVSSCLKQVLSIMILLFTDT